MTLEVSFHLSVFGVLTGRMQVKKCKTSLLDVLELLQSPWRKGSAVGNLQTQLANGGVHPPSAPLSKGLIS